MLGRAWTLGMASVEDMMIQDRITVWCGAFASLQLILLRCIQHCTLQKEESVSHIKVNLPFGTPLASPSRSPSAMARRPVTSSDSP